MTTRSALVPALGISAATAIIVSNIVGQGVFLKGRAMACETGSPALELAAWIVAGLISLFGALSFAELAAMLSEAGGVYVYARRAFGERTAFVVGWMTVVIAAPAAIGALAQGAAIFFDRITGNALAAVPGGETFFAIGIIVMVTLVNLAPVGANGAIANISAILKLGTLAGIAVAGFVIARGLDGSHVAPALLAALPCADVPPASRVGIAGFASAMLAALYAYNGWSSISNVASEVRAPTVTIPRALFGGVTIVIVLYTLANSAFIRVLGFTTIERLVPSTSLGVVSAEALFGSAIAIGSSAFLLVSVIATLHVTTLHYSRVTYALASDGLFFPAVARVSRAGVPYVAVIATSVIATALAATIGFDRLSDIFVFTASSIYVLSVIALFVLRVREPNTPRPFRVTAYPFVPGAFVLVLGYVLISTAVAKPIDFGTTLAVGIVAIPIYEVIRRRAAQKK